MRSELLLVPSMVVLAGCADVTPSPNREPGWVRLNGAIAFEASGNPSFANGSVVPATFATAIVDSAAGVYILAFNQKDGTRGDFFVLRVEERRTGTFGPCGDVASQTVDPDGSILTVPRDCQGSLMVGVDVQGQVFAAMQSRRVMAGTVTVDAVGERLIGSVSNLRLDGSGADSTSQRLLISTGGFDLPLLTGEAARQMTYCFLARATAQNCEVP